VDNQTSHSDSVATGPAVEVTWTTRPPDGPTDSRLARLIFGVRADEEAGQ
jgi:hypothetical protein